VLNKKSVVIWDWNGTLVDDGFLFVKIMNVFLLEKKLRPISVVDYKNFFEFPLENYYLNLGFDFKDESFESLGRRFIQKYLKHRFEASLFSGAKNLLSEIHAAGTSQFVVSAQEHSMLVRAVDYYGLSCLFSECFGVHNFFARGKVDLVGSLYKKHLDSSFNVFLVGDTLYDAVVGNSIGAKVVLVSFGHCSKKRLSSSGCLVVDSFSELRDCLFSFFSG